MHGSPTTPADGRVLESPLAGLQGFPFFSKLAAEDLACFQSLARSVAHKKGKVLYLEGDGVEFFYVICSGWIKLFHTTPEGDEAIVDMLTTGSMVGENAVFEHGYYTSSAEIIEDVQLLALPSKALYEKARLRPALALELIA